MVTDTNAHSFDADCRLIAQETDSEFFSKAGTDQRSMGSGNNSLKLAECRQNF